MVLIQLPRPPKFMPSLGKERKPASSHLRALPIPIAHSRTCNHRAVSVEGYRGIGVSPKTKRVKYSCVHQLQFAPKTAKAVTKFVIFICERITIIRGM